MLEKCGVRVFNKSAVIELCDDKKQDVSLSVGKKYSHARNNYVSAAVSRF